MLTDNSGNEVTPLTYVRFSNVVKVKYDDGTTASISLKDIKAPGGYSEVVEKVRVVRIDDN